MNAEILQALKQLAAKLEDFAYQSDTRATERKATRQLRQACDDPYAAIEAAQEAENGNTK